MTRESSWKVVDLKWWNIPVPLWRMATDDKPAERIGFECIDLLLDFVDGGI